MSVLRMQYTAKLALLGSFHHHTFVMLIFVFGLFLRRIYSEMMRLVDRASHMIQKERVHIKA